MVTEYHPGVNHGHRPSGRWEEVQAKPNSSFVLNFLCPRMTPRQLVDVAILTVLKDKPLALNHLWWYLAFGSGGVYREDENIDAMLRQDTLVQSAIAAAIPPLKSTGRFTTYLELRQADYAIGDFRLAFGAIDRLDLEVDFDAGSVHVWFQDRYEWHPVYPGLYDKFPDDVWRDTNCLHAALVELKAMEAADFWMKGEATVPLSLFHLGARKPGSGVAATRGVGPSCGRE